MVMSGESDDVLELQDPKECQTDSSDKGTSPSQLIRQMDDDNPGGFLKANYSTGSRPKDTH